MKLSILILLIIIIVLVVFLVYIYFDNKKIELTFLNIKNKKIPKVFDGFTILQLSDLHSSEFGNNNEKLINYINKANPDIIVMTGDMISRTDKNGDIVLSLVKELNYKYPIYYILGNHELDVLDDEEEWINDYLNKLDEMNVNILRDNYIVYQKENETINIYGFEIPKDNYVRFKKYTKIPLEIPKEISNIKENEFNILLAHNPAYFEKYANIGYDLIFSGHVHGGSIRVPFFGGLLSSDVTIFPKYDAGMYKIKDSTLVVSRGFGGLRIFNRPNIVVVKLEYK